MLIKSTVSCSLVSKKYLLVSEVNCFIFTVVIYHYTSLYVIQINLEIKKNCPLYTEENTYILKYYYQVLSHENQVLSS